MRNFLSTSFTLSIAVFLVAACASSNPASLTQNGLLENIIYNR